MAEPAASSVGPGTPVVISPAAQDALSRLWSVQVPGWLDPYAPQWADAFADGAWTARWGTFPALAPLAAAALGFFFAVFWPWIDYVYSESLVFMGLLIAAALLSGPLGVMMFFGYIVGDFLGDVFQGYYTRAPLGMAGGRLVSYILLGLLAVRVPALARRMAERAPLPAEATLRLAVRLFLYAAASALLVFLWCQAMIVLIRPVFTWVRQSPTTEAIMHVQTQWEWLVAVAVVASLARLALETSTSGSGAGAALVASLQQERWSHAQRRGEFTRRLMGPGRLILATLVVTLLLSGTYEGWIDPLIVAGIVVFLGAWRYGLIGRLPTGWVSFVRKIPALVRLAVAALVGYVFAYVVLWGLWRLGSLRAVAAGSLLTLAMFYLLFPGRRQSALAGGRQRE